MPDPSSRPTPPAEAIAAYREALLRHAPPNELAGLAAALDPETVAWLDLFQTSRREAIRPDPAFVRRLDRIVAAAPGPTPSRPTTGRLAPLRVLRSHTMNGRRQHMTASATIPASLHQPWHIAWPRTAARLAAAVLLIALLVGSAWTALYPLGLWDNEGLPLFAPLATPTATAPVGMLEFLWESEGGPEKLSRPYGLGIDPEGNLWVSDAGNDRFQILAPDGSHIETWGAPGEREGEFEFYSPRSMYGAPYGDVAFDADGNIYVVDTGNFRVQKFAPDRSFLLAWGEEGEGDGQFLAPSSIAIGPEGVVYVSDESRADVQMFDADGQFLGVTGEAPEGSRIYVPGGIAVDREGNVWVADFAGSVILQYSRGGELLTSWGARGMKDGQLSSPNDVALDGQGHVFVADDGNNRLQVFTTDGKFLAKAGDEESVTTTRFADAVAVAVSRDGVVYVSDDPTIQAFRFTMSTPG